MSSKAKSSSTKASASSAPSSSSSSSSSSSPVDVSQLKNCLLALYSQLQKDSDNAASKQLLDDDEEIAISVQLKKTPSHASNKPIRIPIPHSLYNPSNFPGSEICLFTKDPVAASDADPSNVSGVPVPNPYKDRLASKPVAGVTKVLAVSKLRKNYHQFADRRRLLGGFSLFLADDRIIPLLPALLGAKFYEKKKQPIPVNINIQDFQSELTRARDSTYMYISSGSSLHIRISRSSYSRAQTLDNILAALPVIADNVPKKWAGIQSIHIKSQNSIALPVYNSLGSVEPVLANPVVPKESKKAASQKKKQGAKRPLTASSSKKKPASDSNKKQKTKEKSDVKTDGKTASTKKPATAAASATPAKANPAKRAREEEAPAAPKSPVVEPSAKKQKKVESTPAKAAPAAAPKAVSQSAKKAVQTPKAEKSASVKKVPSTVASKKK